MVILSVLDIALLIAGLAFYLFIVGGQLNRIATNLEECAGIVRTIVGHAEAIEPGVEHINRTGGVVAGALPLLYGMAEGIVAGVTPRPAQPVERGPAPLPAARRGRLPAERRRGAHRRPRPRARAAGRRRRPVAARRGRHGAAGSSGLRPVRSGPVVGAVYSPIHSSFQDCW
jgi:hypothetical protein